MDITGIDVGALIAGVGALANSLYSGRKADSNNRAIDERVAVLENSQQHYIRRLDDGDKRFVALETKVDGTRADVSDIKADVKFIRGVFEGLRRRK